MWSRSHKARGQGQGHKKIRGQGQGQPYRGQTLSRPRTGMLEAKDQGYNALQKQKKSSEKIFRRSQKQKRSSEKIFRRFPEKKLFSKKIFGAPHTFNNSKNSAVLEPRTGQFSRT